MAGLPTTSKQDRHSVRNAIDLERKYKLAEIAGMKKAIENSVEGLNKINKTLENFIVATLGSIEELQNQIDGNITTWFYEGEPTMDNAPADEWNTDELKGNHIGDLYYDQNTGYAYRFTLANDTYSWLKLSDSDITEALSLANAASDTADSKRRVFTDTPYPPYDNGDLWFNSKEIYICQISKGKDESYEEKDFIIATKYTDDTVAERVGDELKIVQGTVTTIQENAEKFKLEITTTIDGLSEKITSAQTTIEANTKAIELRVKQDNIISVINQSAEAVKIKANKIELEGAVTADMIDVEDLFSQEIEATGSITGATIVSISDVQKVVITEGYIKIFYLDTRGEGGWIEVGSIYATSAGDIAATGNWIFDSVETQSGADLDTKAPTYHASTATTYGAGTASNYGHVKLSDNYASSAGAASASVAASSKAVYDCYTALKSVTVGTITPAYTGYTADYRIFKNNKLVNFQVSSLWLASITAQSWTTLGTVPSEYRPTADSVLTAATVSNASNGNVLGAAKVEVLTTGVIRVKSAVTSSSAVGISCHLAWDI